MCLFAKKEYVWLTCYPLDDQELSNGLPATQIVYNEDPNSKSNFMYFINQVYYCTWLQNMDEINYLAMFPSTKLE